MVQKLVSVNGSPELIIDRDIEKDLGNTVIYDTEGDELGRVPNNLKFTDIQLVFLFHFADKSFSKGVVAGMTKKQNEFKRVLGITDK